MSEKKNKVVGGYCGGQRDVCYVIVYHIFSLSLTLVRSRLTLHWLEHCDT